MAEIKFACPGCHVTLKVSDALAGKKIKCPKCAAIAPIPAASAAPAAPAAAPKAPAPVAKPVMAPPPVTRKPVPPPQAPLAPPLDLSELEGNGPGEIEEMNERPAPRSRRSAPPKKSSSLLSMLALVLALLYI